MFGAMRSRIQPRSRIARLRDRVHVLSEDVRLRGRGAHVHVFWFDQHANFGDRLTSWILPHYGALPVMAEENRIEAIGVGSLLGWLPADFSGYVLGSGSLEPQSETMPNARFVAIRGELSRDAAGAPLDTPLGDFGLLSPEVFGRATPSGRVGVVPHLTHRSSEWVHRLSRDPRAVVIDVRDNPRKVCRTISSCTTVVTSSLHGLIIADAYGVPAVWGTPAPKLVGDDFKFKDHHSAIGLDAEARRVPLEHIQLEDAMKHAKAPDAASVLSRQQDLEAAVRRFVVELQSHAG